MDYEKKKCAYQPHVLKFTAYSLVRFQCVQNEVHKSVEGVYEFRGKVRWALLATKSRRAVKRTRGFEVGAELSLVGCAFCYSRTQNS